MANDAEQPAEPANKSILDEVNSAHKWFHAKKTAGLWARLLEQPETVQTLEGPLEASAGDLLCRGADGELWPQTTDSVHSKYVPTDEIDADGFRKYVPDPAIEGVMAAEIDHPFELTAAWGQLTGKPGDFVIKSFEDRDAEYPNNVWLVDAELFRKTYVKVSN